jgi:hypothetical protein
MVTPLVSVLMSVLNGEGFLAEAVESILNQSFSDFELIVINDGSTDSSGAILESYQKKDPRLRVYHQGNRGLVESLNRGCALVRGRYIARMGADDIAIRDRLLWQVDFVEKHPDVGLLGGAVEVIDGRGKSLHTSVNPTSDGEIKLAFSRGVCPFWDTTVITRRDVFASVGGYRKLVVYAEDHDLFLRIADCYELANLEAVLVKYRLHSGQVTVRKCKQATLSALAAQAAAASRKNGNPDPLNSVGQITPALLAKLGVSEARMHATLAEKYLHVVQTMCDAHEYSMATEALDEMSRSCRLKLAEKRVAANLHLLAARLSWHNKKYATSILNAGQAFITRPLVLGRPLKPWLRRFRPDRPGFPGHTIQNP